eukprot:COSAG04_NODE_14852_length_552_cov_1.562914_2_plen_44_part_01
MRRLPPAARTQLYPIIQQIDEDGETPTWVPACGLLEPSRRGGEN